MKSKTKAIPDGYHTVTPYLVITDAAMAIRFYKEVFGATGGEFLTTPDGKIAHAEIRIGDSVIMLCDECLDWNALSPQTVGGTSVSIMLYVEDVDSIVNRAVISGAQLVMPVSDQFWGDRMGTFIDPFGHKWSVATHIEDVPPEEMCVRAREFFGKA